MKNNCRCLIVDDEPIAQRIIIGYLNDILGYEVVATAANALEAMSVLESKTIDLMFLDIEMPKLKGLAFLKTLKTSPSVIITTAHREYAYDSYDLEVVDYLLKPISFERFIRAINRYKKLRQSTDTENESSFYEERYIYVKSDRKTLKLPVADILYIEGMNNYIIIHMPKAKHVVYKSMIDIHSTLGDRFVRIHKSFIVNRFRVKGFTKELVMLESIELPIGKSYKEKVGRL